MMKADLSGVTETMLQTLYARAKESERSDRHIYDAKAVEIVKSLDYDFSAAESDKAMSTGVIARTIVLDRMVSEWLERNPGATVINIACGLDTRCCRMEGKYAGWWNIDLTETIEVRKMFLEEDGPVHKMASSAMDPAWAENIGRIDSPVLVIIEGLTMYLREEDVKEIFYIIEKNYPGATVFCETMNPFVVSHIKEKSIEGSRAKFSWGVKNGGMLERVLPSWKCTEEHSLTEGMQEFIPIYRFLGKIGFVRNISNKILRLELR